MTITKPVLSPLRVEPIHPAVTHYYDEHPTAEDLMGESIAQSTLIAYLRSVLMYLYHAEGWFIAPNFNLYSAPDRMAYPITPDLALFKGIVSTPVQPPQLKSWRLYLPENPPPQVVFEVSSDATWEKDLLNKPAAYAALGVQEYYAYDPNEPPNWPAGQGRLRGWHRSNNGFVEQTPMRDGRLWSPELASWLIPDGFYLRLADRVGVIRLTEAEAERLARERETQRAEAERQAKEVAWAKLRELNIDPATLFGQMEPD